MDHSLQGYLSRRTEDELGTMLRHYVVQQDWRKYVREIALIAAELNRRWEKDPEHAGIEKLR